MTSIMHTSYNGWARFLRSVEFGYVATVASVVSCLLLPTSLYRKAGGGGGGGLFNPLPVTAVRWPTGSGTNLSDVFVCRAPLVAQIHQGVYKYLYAAVIQNLFNPDPVGLLITISSERKGALCCYDGGVRIDVLWSFSRRHMWRFLCPWDYCGSN